LYEWYCLDILSRLHVAARAVTCFATPSMGLETANPGMDRKRSLSPVTVTRIRVETALSALRGGGSWCWRLGHPAALRRSRVSQGCSPRWPNLVLLVKSKELSEMSTMNVITRSLWI